MDAFETLRISRDADTRQIRVAYRREARAVHPDVGGDADSFVRLQEAYRAARSTRAATKVRLGERRSESARYDLAEIAYRFELGRPGHGARSFVAAIDAELNPDGGDLELPPDASELISYLIGSKVDLALIVAAIVREIDNARAAPNPD